MSICRKGLCLLVSAGSHQTTKMSVRLPTLGTGRGTGLMKRAVLRILAGSDKKSSFGRCRTYRILPAKKFLLEAGMNTFRTDCGTIL
jgi:hypothetical protein